MNSRMTAISFLLYKRSLSNSFRNFSATKIDSTIKWFPTVCVRLEECTVTHINERYYHCYSQKTLVGFYQVIFRYKFSSFSWFLLLFLFIEHLPVPPVENSRKRESFQMHFIPGRSESLFFTRFTITFFFTILFAPRLYTGSKINID